jgi:hypothetical protein
VRATYRGRADGRKRPLCPNPLIRDALGILDGSGQATATIQVPPLPPGFVGSRFYHAYVVFTTHIDYASTPVPLTLVK